MAIWGGGRNFLLTTIPPEDCTETHKSSKWILIMYVLEELCLVSWNESTTSRTIYFLCILALYYMDCGI